MRSAWRQVVVCVACCAAAFLGVPAAALAEEPVATTGGSGSSLTGPLVVSGSPTEAEQLKAQEEAWLASPEAVAAREESQTKYAGLGAEASEHADGEAFPVLIDDPAGGPRLSLGEQIAGLPSDFAVSVSGGSGGREVREATEPIAMQDVSGTRVPIDLALSDRGSAFTPITPLAPVLIPKRLSEGASLSDAGVSLTPVDESGAPLPGEGVVDGAMVFYPDTEVVAGGVADMDTIVKPLTFGLELQTSLRSDRAPSKLYFKVGLPEGAKLVQQPSGSVSVVSGEAKLAMIFAPSAQDAQGVAVPTSMSLDGDTLIVGIDHPAGAYAYPIMVDPRYEYYASEFTWDTQVNKSGAHATNWHFESSPEKGSLFTGSEAESGQGWDVKISGSHGEHELGDMVYTTKKESHVWDFASETSQHESNTRVETLTKVENSTGVEEDHTLSTEVSEPKWNIAVGCRMSAEKCFTGVKPEYGNSAVYESVASGVGTGTAGENVFRKAEVAIQQPGNPEVKFDTTDETVEGHPNALYGTKTWLGPYSGALVKITPSDKGIGVEAWSTEHTNVSGAWEALSEKSLMSENLCEGIQCPSETVTYVGYSSALPDGEPKLGADAWNALYDSHAKENEPEAARRVAVRVDSTPPHNIVLKGLPAEGTVTTGEYHLTAEATDGSGTTPSSGVKSVALFVDGQPLGTPSGSCSPGPCTATGNPVTLNTEEYAAGKHILTIRATDNAENATSTETTFTVQPAATTAAGPGSMNLLSGRYTLEASDVAMGAGLAVNRSYGSRTPAANSTVGPFGSQWSFSLGGQESIVKLANENVVLTSASGARLIFVSNSKGGFESPATDRNLTLTFEEPGGVREYVLKNTAADTSTSFREPSGGSGEVWMPSIQTGPVATDTIAYSYETTTVEGQSVTRPTQALAPVPAGVSCSPKLERGCRALVFKYAEETTTKAGENENAWGLYKGRLKEVKFVAYDPVSKEMKEPAVAEYLYDKQGRLRAVWDPRVSPALKMKYGYDGEGHVTAVTPPGQESWAFTYGTTESDPNTGRLLRVTRAPASAPLWNGEVPTNLELPKPSGAPAVGVRMAVSNGKWGNSPVVYGYQWERCNVEGKECAPIAGATNPNYTPTAADEQHTLVVEVAATNGGGSVTVSSTASGVVVATAGAYVQSVDGSYSLNAVSCISATTTCVLSDSAGKALYATNVSSSSGGTWTSWTGPGASPSEAVNCPASSLCLMAAGEKTGYGGSLYYATSLGGAWSLAYTPSYGVDAISCVSTSFCADGQDGAGYFRWSTSPASTSWNLQEQGTAAMKAISCLSASFCAIADSAGNVHVATTESQIKSSSWTQTDVDGATAVNGIACLSTSSCVAVDKTGNELTLKIESSGSATATKHNIDGTTSLTGVACPSSSTCVAVDSTGHVFVSTSSGETWTSLYALRDDLTAVSCASTSLCVATDTSGKVTSFNLSGTRSEGEALSPQAGSTIEYNLPVSGSGAPYEMGTKEVEAWSQKDDPAYATAIFPPNEPQGWPASGHKGATIDYLDSHGRLVNTATPSEGVTTTEYNEQNDVTRTLSVDNRATALKEGAKSAEVAERLDTRSTYNSEGTELQSTLGPRHLVKLSNGKEVQARNHTVYSYDEGAPSEGGPYRLVTKVVQEAQTETEGEQDPRTTTTSYSGQTNLGWRLRKPTSVTGDPSGLKITHSTTYDESTGNVVETQTPAANGEAASELKSFFSFGGSGSGAGQLEKPVGVATDSAGNVWVADTGHDRVQEFNVKGEFVREFGAEGSGNGAFIEPRGIAVSAAGNVYVADDGNYRVQEFNSTGGFVRAFGGKGTGEGQFDALRAVAVDGEGHVWTIDAGYKLLKDVPRVEEFSAEGVFMKQFGVEGVESGQFKEPKGVAVDSKGNVWVADTANNRVQEFKPTGEWVRAFGAEGSGNGQFKAPTGVVIDSEGDPWVADSGNNRVQRFNSEGGYLSQVGTIGNNNGQFNKPEGVATDSSGNVWVADTANNRVQELTGSEFVLKFGGSGSGAGQLEKPVGVATDSAGNVWVADTGHDRVQEFNVKGEFVREFGAEGSGNGEFKELRGIAVSSAGNVYVADDGNARVQEFNSKGEFVRVFGSKGTGEGQFDELRGVAVDGEGHVWTIDAGMPLLKDVPRVEEFSSEGVFVKQFGAEGTESGKFKGPEGLGVDSKGNVWVADTSNNRVQEFKSTGEFVRAFGAEGSGNGQFVKPTGVAFDAEGDPWVADPGNNRVQRFNSEGGYLSQVGTIGNNNGQFNKPEGVAIEGSGNAVAADTANNRVQVWTPEHRFAHDAKTAYYTPGAESRVEACRNHPEWANLPCRTESAGQPVDAGQGAPALPVVTTTYNLYGQPTETKSTVTECVKVSPGAGKYTNNACTSSGSGEYELKTNTRTTTITYDEASRLKSSEISSTIGKAMPAVTDKYSETTGAPIEQATSTESIKSAYNTLGQMTSYTDASGKITTYEYEGEGKYTGEKELDGRPRSVNDGQGTETYAYNETTGALSELTISGAGTFSASYDTEGNMLSERYPDGMSATYAYNQTGQPTSLVYNKETHCTEGCEWFKDSVVPSIHDQWATQTSNLGVDTYGYDAAGRLTEATQTPAGKGCVTRRYAYDEDTNRTSLTTYAPNSKNECSTTSGSTEEKHSYDEADRLTDPGAIYEPFGETTKLTASDAGGSELVSTFYADSQLHEQKQGEGASEQTIGYTLDPAGRTEEVVSTGKVVATEALHYTGPASTPAWTSEPSGKTTRMMSAMSGLVAIQHGTETPTLQLSNLHGDIVGTAEDSETANKLASTIAEPTEYGVPATEAPPKYSWLGAHELPTELPSGVTAMGARSYVPQLGRFLQTDPVAGGSANPYAYTNGNPVNETDLTGQYVENNYVMGLGMQQNAAAIEAEAAREAAIRAEEERKAREAAIQAAMAAKAAAELAEAEARNAWDAAAAGDESGEEWWEEEEEYEYTAWHHKPNAKHESGQIEGGLLYQPFGGEPVTSQIDQTREHLARLCQTEVRKQTNVSRNGACARYVSIFGEIWHAVKHAWHVITHGAKHIYESLHQLYWSARAWYNLNVGPVIHHWECVADGATIGLLAGVGTASAGPWASGYIAAGAGVGTSELCERA